VNSLSAPLGVPKRKKPLAILLGFCSKEGRVSIGPRGLPKYGL